MKKPPSMGNDRGVEGRKESQIRPLNQGIFFNEGIQLMRLSMTHRAELDAQLPHLESTERNEIIDMDIRNLFTGDTF